jgi:hypothetical protein
LYKELKRVDHTIQDFRLAEISKIAEKNSGAVLSQLFEHSFLRDHKAMLSSIVIPNTFCRFTMLFTISAPRN